MKVAFIVAIHLISLVAYTQDGKTRMESDASSWDIGKLSTGQSASFLSPLEKEVLLELNKVRSNPRLYAQLYISPMLDNFDGKIGRAHV